MNEPPAPATPREIQLDRADFARSPAAGPRCDLCGHALAGCYFEIDGKMACEGCRLRVEETFHRKGGAGAFVKAALAGLGAAVAGSLVYYAVREATGYEIGLISILVGWGVGKAVHWGSRGKGGWVYQSLAVLLTYLAIVSTYVPVIVAEAAKPSKKDDKAAAGPAQAGGAAAAQAAGAPRSERPQKPEEDVSLGEVVQAIGALVLLAAAIPFLMGFKNVVGLLIIAFGLWEASKINRRRAPAIAGPFQVGAAPATLPIGP